MVEDLAKQTTLPDLTSDIGAALPSPKQIGPYKIESLFSKGGMSFLYLALHPKTQKPLIVKILSPKFIKNREVVDRFLKEAHIIGMTHHPNIVQLYGEGPWEKGLYIAMEFIQGISLRQFIQKRSFSTKKALEIVLQVAYALCHLHTHGVIHRDLKPENILITENGEIKVIDFGIAQLSEEKKIPKKPGKKRTIGTPSYMSPEQKLDPSGVTFASDIYSLGMITYELVTGQLSHGTVHFSLIPKNLRPILEKALDPDLTKRYQDIVDFITDISSFLKNNREEQEEKDLDSVFDALKESSRSLFTTPQFSFPQLDIKASFEESFTLTGIYLDIFKFTENTFALFLAEPKNVGLSTLFQTAQLKGMLRMLLAENAPLSSIQPESAIGKVNHSLSFQADKAQFHFLYLLMRPEMNQIFFAMDDNFAFYHIPEEATKIKPLTTPNPILGKGDGLTFSQTSINWNIHDKLLITTKQTNVNLQKLLQSSESEIISLLAYPPSHLAEKILQLTSDEEKKDMHQRFKGVLCIERKH